MKIFELQQEQYRLAKRVQLEDTFEQITRIAGVFCTQKDNKLVACVAVCSYPEMTFIDKAIYLLHDPLPHKPGFLAYQQVPAILEACNSLENDPNLVLIYGPGIAHPRGIGLASHTGVALNIPTIGVTEKLVFGKIEQEKIFLHNKEVGFSLKTKEHGNPLYISPGHGISLVSSQEILKKTIKPPHKLPEPLHIARKIAKKAVQESL